ncbi:telomere recombination family protein [Bordetella holmesii ATCC 51541]|nr:telomere recombination family protein [Bordetella holmesii ATCC 51541]
MLSTTLIPRDEEDALNDPEDIGLRYAHELAAVIDAGACAQHPTTVIDLTGDEPVVLRRGRGDPQALGLS